MCLIEYATYLTKYYKNYLHLSASVLLSRVCYFTQRVSLLPIKMTYFYQQNHEQQIWKWCGLKMCVYCPTCLCEKATNVSRYAWLISYVKILFWAIILQQIMQMSILQKLVLYCNIQRSNAVCSWIVLLSGSTRFSNWSEWESALEARKMPPIQVRKLP
jgi:hypothetical protein